MFTKLLSPFQNKKVLSPKERKQFISEMNHAICKVNPYAIACVLNDYGLFSNPEFKSFCAESIEHLQNLTHNEYQTTILETWYRDNNCVPLYKEDKIQGIYIQYQEKQEFITYTKVIGLCVYYKIKNEQLIGLQWCKKNT